MGDANVDVAAWWPRLHSFCIGLENAPDLIAAKKVADFLGTVHHEFYFTVQEGVDALRDVIYHLETYDVTTISFRHLFVLSFFLLVLIIFISSSFFCTNIFLFIF